MASLNTSESLAKATARCLLNDTEMRIWLSAAITKMDNERFKHNLVILLQDFAQGLTTDLCLRTVAHFVGSRTLVVVDQMLSELSRGTQTTIETSLPSYEDVTSATDEIQDLVETVWKFRTPNLVEVNTALSQFDDIALQHSLPFIAMKEDLRRFVFPSMKSYIRESILPSLPATDLAPICSVAVRVHWELESYLERGFVAKGDIGDVTTLTGEVARAQALPCGEYMQQAWPETGAATLAAVKDALLQRHSYHQYSPTQSIQLKFEESEVTASGKALPAIERPLLVRIEGRPVEVVETIEQLAWFASAFRYSGENSTALSQVDFRVVSELPERQGLMTELTVLPLRSCKVLASGFPIKEKEQAVGLEIPYQLLLRHADFNLQSNSGTAFAFPEIPSLYTQ